MNYKCVVQKLNRYDVSLDMKGCICHSTNSPEVVVRGSETKRQVDTNYQSWSSEGGGVKQL